MRAFFKVVSCCTLFSVVLLRGVSDAGDLIVIDRDNNALVRYDATSGAFLGILVASGAGLSQPHAAVIGPDGNLYVSSVDNNRVFKYDFSNQALTAFAPSASSSPSTLTGPTGLAFGPDGHLYVSSVLTNSVVRFNGSTGDFLDVFVSPGLGGLNGPRPLAFGADGTLYVGSYESDAVLAYDRAGLPVGGFALSVQEPLAMAFGPDRALYVASDGNACCAGGKNVARFDPKSGALLGEVIGAGASGLGVPGTQLAFGPDNDLYVASRSPNAVLRYRTGQSGGEAAAVGVFVPAPDAPPLTGVTGFAFAGVKLRFPLPSQGPYTAKINSVFDHHVQLNTDGKPAFYHNDHVVTVFTGEVGECARLSARCAIAVTAKPLYELEGVVDAQGVRQPFSVNGQYNPTEPLFIAYEGHPGYDYQAPKGSTPITTPANGIAFVPDVDRYTGDVNTFKVLAVYHGQGVASWFLHLGDDASQEDFRVIKCPGQQEHPMNTGSYGSPIISEPVAVTVGCQIASSTGNAGVSNAHLHFEVRIGVEVIRSKNRVRFRCVPPGCRPVDPYGWADPLRESFPIGDPRHDPTHDDPYPAGPNVRMWE